MKTKVLYIEDEEDWRSMVGLFLKLAGYEVLTANDASSGMLQAEQPEVGVIILDLNLAGEDGRQLIGFLKMNRPTVPVILYTGRPEADAAFASLVQEGADQCLRKGNLRELLSAVQWGAAQSASRAAERSVPSLLPEAREQLEPELASCN